MLCKHRKAAWAEDAPACQHCHRELKQQRDDLLAAAKNVPDPVGRSLPEWSLTPSWYVRLQEAIANVEAGS